MKSNVLLSVRADVIGRTITKEQRDWMNIQGVDLEEKRRAVQALEDLRNRLLGRRSFKARDYCAGAWPRPR